MINALKMESRILIRAAPERVWAVFSEVGRWVDWCNVCLRADTEPGFNWGVGDRLGLKFKIASVGVPFNVTMIESEPGRRVAWESTKFTVTATRTFSFAPAGHAVQVIDHKLYRSPVLPLAFFYPRPIIRRMTESHLSDLKAECERDVSP